MALTEDELVQILQDATTEHIQTLDTQAKWVNFVQTINKNKVKTFIQNRLNATAQSYDTSAANLEVKADDLENLATLVGNL